MFSAFNFRRRCQTSRELRNISQSEITRDPSYFSAFFSFLFFIIDNEVKTIGSDILFISLSNICQLSLSDTLCHCLSVCLFFSLFLRACLTFSNSTSLSLCVSLCASMCLCVSLCPFLSVSISLSLSLYFRSLFLLPPETLSTSFVTIFLRITIDLLMI